MKRFAVVFVSVLVVVGAVFAATHVERLRGVQFTPGVAISPPASESVMTYDGTRLQVTDSSMTHTIPWFSDITASSALGVDQLHVVAAYELTSTSGPNGNGTIHQETLPGGVRLDKLSYNMEVAPTLDTVLQLTDGIVTASVTIPTGGVFGTADLSGSLIVGSGNTLTVSVLSGTGGTPQLLNFTAAAATASNNTGQALDPGDSPTFAGITIAGVSNTANDLKIDTQTVSASSVFTVTFDVVLPTSSTQVYSHSFTIAESEAGAFDDTIELFYYSNSGRLGTPAYTSTGNVRIYSIEATVTATAGNNYAVFGPGYTTPKAKDAAMFYSSVAGEDEGVVVDYIVDNVVYFQKALQYNHAIGQNLARKVFIMDRGYNTAGALQRIFVEAIFGSEVTTTLSSKCTHKR